MNDIVTPHEFLRAPIKAIMAEHPDLSSTGWRSWRQVEADIQQFEMYRCQMQTDNFRAMVSDAIIWLALRPISPRRTSYGLKHAAEAEIGRYITNGAFIVAAILVGYKPSHLDGGPNCGFHRPRSRELHHSLQGGDYDRGWPSTRE